MFPVVYRQKVGEVENWSMDEFQSPLSQVRRSPSCLPTGKSWFKAFRKPPGLALWVGMNSDILSNVPISQKLIRECSPPWVSRRRNSFFCSDPARRLGQCTVLPTPVQGRNLRAGFTCLLFVGSRSLVDWHGTNVPGAERELTECTWHGYSSKSAI